MRFLTRAAVSTVGAMAILFSGISAAAYAATDASANADEDNPKLSVNFDFSRPQGQPESQRASAPFEYGGTITCNQNVGTYGCRDLVLTIPVPDTALPEGSLPFSQWQASLTWPKQEDPIIPTLNQQGTAWTAQLPSLSAGQQESFTLTLQNSSSYQPLDYSFTVQPVLSGSQFSPVTAPAVEYTGTQIDPQINASLQKITPSTSEVYPGSQITLSPQVWGLAGGYSSAAVAPGSANIDIPLDGTPFQFVGFADQDDDDAAAATYNQETNTISYSNFGLTVQQVLAGQQQSFVPFIVKIADDYQVQNTGLGDKALLTGNFTAKTISFDSKQISASASMNPVWIKQDLQTNAVATAYLGSGPITDPPAFWGNRGGQMVAPLPDFAGQSTFGLRLLSSSVDYRFDALWGVPCRGDFSDGVRIASDANCASQNIAFDVQKLWISSDTKGLELPATVTYDNGQTQALTLSSSTQTTLSSHPGKVVSVRVMGDLKAGQSAILAYTGQFPQGSMDGTAAAANPDSDDFQVSLIWQVSAARAGNALPAATKIAGTVNATFGTGTSEVNLVTNAQAGTTQVSFSRFTSANSGPVQAAVLLPQNLVYNGVQVPKGQPLPTVQTDWKGTGQTLITYSIAEDQSFYATTVQWLAQKGGTYEIQTAANAGTDKFTGDQCWSGGSNSSGPTSSDLNSFNYSGTWVPSGATSGMLTDDPYGSCLRTSTFVVSGENANEVEGWIKKADEEVWTPSPGLPWFDSAHPDGVKAGQQVDFRLRLQNPARNNMDDPVSYVGIPQVGATNPLQDNQQIGTGFNMTLAGAVDLSQAPAGWSVAYSTSATPCQPQMGVTANCQDDWSTTPPTDLSQVRFLRFTAPMLQTGDSATFTYPLQVPTQNQICTQLGKPNNCDQYLSQVSWNLVTLGYQVPGISGQQGLRTSYAPRVGVGKFTFAPVYPNLTATVLDSSGNPTGTKFARSGDTVRFVQKLSRPDDPLQLSPRPVVDVKIPNLGANATVNEQSILVDGQAAGTQATLTDDNKIEWTPGTLKKDSELQFDVVLGDNPPTQLVAQTSVPSNVSFQFAKCVQGQTSWPCNLSATVPVPQVWANVTTNPADGTLIDAGMGIDYRLDLAAGGIDVQAAAKPQPTFTWDVAGIASAGQIKDVHASSGQAAYNPATKKITWQGMDLSSDQAKPYLTFAFQAEPTAAAGQDTKIALNTSLSASLPPQFTPVHQGTPTQAGSWNTNHFLVGETAACPNGSVQLVSPTGDVLSAASFRDTVNSRVSGWPDQAGLTYQWYVRDTPGAARRLVPDATSANLDLGSTPATVVNGMASVDRYLEVEVTGHQTGCSAVAYSQLVKINPIVNRYWGATRYGTAASLNNRFGRQGGTVYVATGQSYPDALSVAPVAARENASLVLTTPRQLSPEARKSIISLHPANVVIIGGEVSVSAAAQQQIEDIVGVDNVSRVGGADRFDTSMMLFEQKFGSQQLSRVYLASGWNFADALVAGPAAAKFHGPVVVVDMKDKGGRLQASLERIAQQQPSVVVALGGTNTLSPKTMDLMQSVLPSAIRVGGQDRYETATLVNQVFGSPMQFAYLASGQVFPDALSAGVPAGHYQTPLYLAKQSCIPEGEAAAIGSARWGEMVIVGGPATLQWGIEKLPVCN